MGNVFDKTTTEPTLPPFVMPFSISGDATTGLNTTIFGGYVILTGSAVPTALADTAIVLNDNATNYISINLVAGTIVNDGAAVVAPHAPIYAITTLAGAIIEVIDLRIVYYPAVNTAMAPLAGATFTGLVNLAAGANIASAATVDLTAATGNCPRITGTVATSAVTMNVGQQMLVVADGAWPLTYHATTNKITGGVDTILAAGDHVLYHKDLSGVVSGIIFRANAGEVVTSYVGATAFAGANTYSDHTSITVTPGRYILGLVASVNKGASDATEARFGIGTVTGNNAANLTIGDTYFDLVPSATSVVTGVIAGWYVSVAVTTTFYLKRRAAYTTGAPDSYGRITAWRL